MKKEMLTLHQNAENRDPPEVMRGFKIREKRSLHSTVRRISVVFLLVLAIGYFSKVRHQGKVRFLQS